MSRQPLLVAIKENCLDDGPGIRSVIFFKGCPLSCAWCHNPECRTTAAQLSFDPGRCTACWEECEPACPTGALDHTTAGFIDRARCTLCFDCVAACPSGALSRVGDATSVEQILARVMRHKPFFDNSGGGVTLSGGEPTYFMAFLSELLQALKAHQIHTLLQTCGAFDLEPFLQQVYPQLDLIYYDLKLLDEPQHQAFCGASNRKILDNFAKLHRMARDGGVALLPRVPLVPGVTDTPENLAGLGAFLHQHGVTEVQLVAYNPLWHDKLAQFGVSASGPELSKRWMAQRDVDACERVFEQAGLQIVR